jgi:hypothetical protein
MKSRATAERTVVKPAKSVRLAASTVRKLAMGTGSCRRSG